MPTLSAASGGRGLDAGVDRLAPRRATIVADVVGEFQRLGRGADSSPMFGWRAFEISGCRHGSSNPQQLVVDVDALGDRCGHHLPVNELARGVDLHCWRGMGVLLRVVAVHNGLQVNDRRSLPRDLAGHRFSK